MVYRQRMPSSMLSARQTHKGKVASWLDCCSSFSFALTVKDLIMMLLSLWRVSSILATLLNCFVLIAISERNVVKQKVFVDTSDCMRKQLIARSRPAQHRPPPAHRKFLASIFSFISQPNYRHRSAIVARSQLHLLLLKQNEVNRYLQPSSRRKRRVQSILGRCSSSSSINDWTRIVIVRISSRPKDDCACRNFSKQLHFARSGRRIVNIRHG